MEKQLDYTKINPHKHQRLKREISHTFDVYELQRLSTWLFDDSGKMTVSCQFDLSAGNVLQMTMTLSGHLKPMCQRCAQPFDYEWRSEAAFVFDEDASVVDGFHDEDFERIPLSYDGCFNLMDVMTDEVILGMPRMHPSECEHDRGLEF